MSERSAQIMGQDLDVLRRRTDLSFGSLLLAQWACGVIIAGLFSPDAWAGSGHPAHLHVWAAVFLGALFSFVPAYLAFSKPGRPLTRHVVAAGQMMTAALLIHLTGGRTETHFHIFGSLAFLAFYRDWRVLLTASTIVIADHAVRGVVWPQSVYGVELVQPWRFAEDAAWVLFSDGFLIHSIRQSLGEMRGIAERQARLEATKEIIEATVAERTEELRAAQEKVHAAELVQEREILHQRFMANMSHDLRTPIASIKGYAETLRLGALADEKNREVFVQIIENNAVRLGQLVEDLLDLSQIENQEVRPKPGPVALAECVGEALRDFMPQLRQKGLTLRAEIPSKLVVEADARHLWRIVQNLLGNAVKFSGQGGAISITAREEERAVVLSVADQGPGIPPEDLPRIFDRFHGQHRGTRAGTGTGLGLAIVKNLIELNGGSITVASAPGQGADFCVSLPRATGVPHAGQDVAMMKA